MFIVIKNDIINLKDISRISKHNEIISVHFISNNERADYKFEHDTDASEVEYKVFKNLEENRLIV